MRRFRKATIKDVAQHAGVSTTTVSLFVSGREDVCSPTTAERIRAAVASLNYTPSSLVSGMQKRTTTTIGVCMFSPLDQQIAYGNLFFERLWRGILQQADRENYSVLHYPVAVRDSARPEPFLDGRVDGVLFHANSSGNDRPGRVAAAGMPVVILTRSLNLPENCGAAYADERRTVDLALSHLWELGHRRIAHIAGPVNTERPLEPRASVDDIAIQRWQSYIAWMQDRNAFDPNLVGYAQGWRGDNVPETIAHWSRLPEPPTAVFCANDTLAFRGIESARRLDWRVPESLSFIGVDNIDMGRDSEIPLTTIDVAIESVGREGLRTILRLMEGAPIEQCRVALPISELVVRSSVAPRT